MSARLSLRTSSTRPCVEHPSHTGGSIDEPEVEDLTGRRDACLGELGLDGAEPTERLTQRVERGLPADSLAGDDETFLPQHLERLADSDATRRVGCAEFSLAGKEASGVLSRVGSVLPRRQLAAKFAGDFLVAGRSHLY